MANQPLSRRRVLGATVTLSAVALAGCSGNGDNGDGSDDSDTDGQGTGTDSGQSFAYDGTGSFEEEGFETDMTMEGQFDGTGNFYTRMEVMGHETEVAHIDGTSYSYNDMTGCTVEEGEPSVPTGAPLGPGQIAPDEWSDIPDYEPDDTATIDGEEMDVYIEESDQHDEVAYMYVDAAGVLRRLELLYGDGELTLDFHSHGESFDIQPPDGC